MEEHDKALLIDELSRIIFRAVPDADTVEKYGGVLFTVKPDKKEGQFCGLFSYEHHVQLVFSRGAQLDDPARLLQGTGKLRRHVNFTGAVDEIDEPRLVEWLRVAAY